MNESVVFSTLDCVNGKKVGIATLNKPKALNALSLDMIDLLSPQLTLWHKDDDISLVIIEGQGDRAFCAGGDVVAMYHAMTASPDTVPSSLEDFFTREYQLDYLIHTYDKPILVWGNGIIMGGGLGLMSGASHKVVTESARIAMPEITIGLYPDVGGSWFLNKMPQGCGQFLGLTGASINAADALYIKLADHFIESHYKDKLLLSISQHNWLPDAAHNHLALSDICQSFYAKSAHAMPTGNVQAHQKSFSPLSGLKSAKDTVNAILAFDCNNDKWLSKAKRSLAAGSPITMHLVFEQLRRAANMTLAQCFQMELTMSCRCGEYGEFREGVRALLVDKDNQPQWRFSSVDDVPVDVVEQFFRSLWPSEQHPLANLTE